MLSFTEYRELSESFRFKNAKDNDWEYGDKMLVFGPDEGKDYKLEGQTHGQISHALKHLHEFRQTEVSSILLKARADIQRAFERGDLKFCKEWSRSGGFGQKEGLQAISNAEAGTILNTLDMVNDKVVLRKPLFPIEKQLMAHLKEFEKLYGNEIEMRIKQAFSLETCKTELEVREGIANHRVIKYYGESGFAVDFYLDFTSFAVIIASPDFVRTLYVMHGNGGKKKADLIRQVLRKPWKIDNPTVAGVFRDIASGRVYEQHMAEASYPGNLGFEELAKFYRKANDKQIDQMEAMLKDEDYKGIYGLLRQVTGVTLRDIVKTTN